ncbi:MAG TPA: GNAT family N-acetyltransferase [Acidimicrobiales bacterium]|nr:GNAT family N-acetyltransferase [Acidimicrobiales bacterium]
MTNSGDRTVRVQVDDVPAESRFVVRGSDGAAELEYQLSGDRLILVHTEVPDAWEGHGVGGQLVRAAIERAAANELTLVPWCPFARRWLGEHKGEVDAAGVSIDWDTPRPPKPS